MVQEKLCLNIPKRYWDKCCIGLRGNHDQNLKPVCSIQVGEVKIKTGKVCGKIEQGFLELFVSNGLQLSSCLSALSLCVAGAAFNRDLMAGVETWTETQTSKALPDG